MRSSTLSNELPQQPLGNLLRYWRRQRAKSQFELALDAGVSQRHLSFIESGRSAPSRDLVVQLSESLDIPLRERNTLLLAAGFAPVYDESAWDTPEMAVVMGAIERVLQQNEPYPALLLDRYWNVLKTNAASPRFFGSFVDLSTRKSPRNLLHLIFDPDGLRPYIENWRDVASGLLQRVAREAVGHVVDKNTLDLLHQLKQYPGAESLSSSYRSVSPVLPITFVKGHQRWSYFSLVSTVGTPQSISAQELRIECMFPIETN